jgi:hypothetical protein
MRNGLVVALLAASSLLVAACTGNSQAPTARTARESAGAAEAGMVTSNGCAGQLPVSPLPVWARAGFNPADQPMPHVMGKAGNIVAIMWASRDALHAPPLPDVGNKILWVSRTAPSGAGPLVIKATLADSVRTATVSVAGGPGPSTIDLPAPGCWTLHLSWSGHTDELELRYVT